MEERGKSTFEKGKTGCFGVGEVVCGGCWDVLVVRQVIAGGAGRRRGTDEGSVIARLRRGAGPPVRLLMENDLMKDCGWMEVEVGQGGCRPTAGDQTSSFSCFFYIIIIPVLPPPLLLLEASLVQIAADLLVATHGDKNEGRQEGKERRGVEDEGGGG